MNKHSSIILIVFVVLVLIGLFMLASASYFESCQKFNDCYHYLKRQLFRSLPFALVGFLFFYFFNYKYLKKLALPIFILSLVLLALVFIPSLGQTKGQASCWVNVFGINFQPSEFAKIGFVIYLSAFFAAKKEQIRELGGGFIPVVFIMGLVMLFFVLQSDLGALAMFAGTGIGLYFLARSKLSHIVVLILILIILGGFLVNTVPYVKERFSTFLNPGQDLQENAFQVNQAELAIGSGGIFGKGLGRSSQKLDVLPEVISDSIFAVLAEEVGFLGSFIVIMLYFLLIYQIFVLSSKVSDEFGSFLSAGLGLFLVIQIFFNVGGNLGVIPLTGVPLPFMGYGGSNLIFLFSALGIILNISKKSIKK